MGKAKSPKLHLSLLTSLQICRPKNPCSMIKSPLPPTTPYMLSLSPLSSKIFDISFPATPIPPPSTPSSKADRGFPSSLKIHPNDSHDEPAWRSRHNKTEHKSKSCLFSPPPMKAVYEEEAKKHKPRRFKRYGSKEWKNEEMEMLAPPPCMDERMEQSYVVAVKKSVDPYEDFKKSISEMIVAKNIFEPRELEQLLMSFLSLNSRLHHKVIIQAFTHILNQLFSG